MKQKILIIEDEKRIAHWLQRYFEKAGYEAEIAYDGAIGLHLAQSDPPDLIVLDLMLPTLDGMEICRRLRRESDIPIIILTARTAYEDRIDGLELGADDYVVKPFDPKEVVARAKAVLRRVKGKAQQQIKLGNIEIDLQGRTVTVAGADIALSRMQFELLSTFMRHPNQVLSRAQLIEAAFDNKYDGFDRAIDTHIRRLRKQIEIDMEQPQYIQTVYGAGYKFVTFEE